MKTLRTFTVLFLLLATPCLAGKKNKDSSDNPNPILVTGVTQAAGSGPGSIAITGGGIFMVPSNTAILIDGKVSPLSQVHAGLEVLSQTAAGSSAPEIDLKTLPPAPAKTKKAKQSSS